VRLAGERALAETNIVILVRQKIAGVLADMTSYARFLDRLERRGGRWAIVERAAVYERDRLDPVEPSEAFDKLFAANDLSSYPEAYRYMAARLDAAGRALARSSIATAPRTRRNCTRATRRGSAGRSERGRRDAAGFRSAGNFGPARRLTEEGHKAMSNGASEGAQPRSV
jgi:hypothetical protein